MRRVSLIVLAALWGSMPTSAQTKEALSRHRVALLSPDAWLMAETPRDRS
jgi:hypothetical protein